MNISEVAVELDIYYKLNHLKIFFEKFLLNFIEHNTQLCKKYKVPFTLIDTPKIQSPKKVHIETLTPFMYHKELFIAMVEAMPPDVQSLVKEMVWLPTISAHEIKSKYQIDVVQSKGRYISSTDAYTYVTPLLLIMNVGYEDNFYFYFTPDLRAHLSTFFERPKNALIQPSDEQSIDKKYLRFEHSEDIFMELPILRTYYAQGQIKINENSIKPNVASLNKARKICNINEFYGIKADKALHNIRTATMIEIFIHESSHQNQFDSKPTHDYIKNFYKNFIDENYDTERLLPHIKGWNNLYQNDVQYLVNRNLNKILEDLPLMAWVSVENIIRSVRFSGLNLELVKPHRARNVLYSKLKNTPSQYSYYYDRGYIGKDNYELLIVQPLIKGFLMMGASLGLLDMVYEEAKVYLSGLVQDDVIFPFEGVKFVRLTALGAYVLGRFPGYAPPKIKETAVELDENALFIHYPSENKALLGMIESISRPAGNNLFKVDFETVLGKCNNKREIDMQISTFKKLLSNNPPEIWKNFFSALQEKSYVFKNKNEEYAIYLLPENKELVNLFAKDEYLKKHVIRAEYYHILIPLKSLTNVKKHLKKSGFLIEFE